MMPMHLCQSLCTKKVDQNSHGLVSLVQTYDSHALVQTYDSHAHQRVTNVLFSLMLLVNVSINFIIFILVALLTKMLATFRTTSMSMREHDANKTENNVIH